eukprot:11216953-Lingulodinium_polyedra.AAC.1
MVLFDSSEDEDESSCPAVPRPADDVAVELSFWRLGRLLERGAGEERARALVACPDIVWLSVPSHGRRRLWPRLRQAGI